MSDGKAAEVSSYQLLSQYVSSLTHLNGRLRPKRGGHADHGQQINSNREPSAWLPKGFIELPRFEMPINLETLSKLTPVTYLTKYCVISSRVKKLLYHRQYSKYKDTKLDGIDSLDKLKKALKDVCTFSVTARSFSPSDSSLNYYVHGVLCYDLNETLRVNFKMFMGLAALAERIFDPNYMESWWESERMLESDYHTYITLREREAQLKIRSTQREQEQSHQQSLKKAAVEKRAQNTARKISANVYKDTSDLENELKGADSSVEIEISSSEKQLAQEVENNRIKLENKISITQILELNSRPKKSPKELMEQVDFHGLQWKLKDIELSSSMERLIRILVSL